MWIERLMSMKLYRINKSLESRQMKMRKTLGILLAVLFLVSLTAAAASAACNSCNWWDGLKNKCDCDDKDKFDCGCKNKCDCDDRDKCECKNRCDCDDRDKCDFGCKDKCECKEKKDDLSWLHNFRGLGSMNWGNMGPGGWNWF